MSQLNNSLEAELELKLQSPASDFLSVLLAARVVPLQCSQSVDRSSSTHSSAARLHFMLCVVTSVKVNIFLHFLAENGSWCV